MSSSWQEETRGPLVFTAAVDSGPTLEVAFQAGTVSADTAPMNGPELGPNGFQLKADKGPLVLPGSLILVDDQGPAGAPAQEPARRHFASQRLEYAEGEAAAAYGGRLYRWRRRLFFSKPDGVLFLLDELEAVRPCRFSWCLKAAAPPAPLSDVSHSAFRVVTDTCRLDGYIVMPHQLEMTFPEAGPGNDGGWSLAAATPRPTRRQRFLAVLVVGSAGGDGPDLATGLEFESEGRTLQGLGRDRLFLQLDGTRLELAQGPRAATDAAWWLMRQPAEGDAEHLVVGGRYFRAAGDEPVIHDQDIFHTVGEPQRAGEDDR